MSRTSGRAPAPIHVYFLPPVSPGETAGAEELMEEVIGMMLRKWLDERAVPVAR